MMDRGGFHLIYIENDGIMVFHLIHWKLEFVIFLLTKHLIYIGNAGIRGGFLFNLH